MGLGVGGVRVQSALLKPNFQLPNLTSGSWKLQFNFRLLTSGSCKLNLSKLIWTLTSELRYTLAMIRNRLLGPILFELWYKPAMIHASFDTKPPPRASNIRAMIHASRLLQNPVSLNLQLRTSGSWRSTSNFQFLELGFSTPYLKFGPKKFGHVLAICFPNFKKLGNQGGFQEAFFTNFLVIKKLNWMTTTKKTDEAQNRGHPAQDKPAQSIPASAIMHSDPPTPLTPDPLAEKQIKLAETFSNATTAPGTVCMT